MVDTAIDQKENSSDSVRYAVEQALEQTEPKPEAHELIARAIKSLTHAMLGIVDDLPKIKGIRSAEGSEVIALIAQEALKNDPLVSKRAMLKIQGQISFRQQIIDAGGAYTTKEVANLLGISASAVRKRLERGRLLAVPLGKSSSYPVWQFDENGVVGHFADVMAMVNTTSPVGMVQFFLTYDEDLGKTPIDVLKGGNLNDVKMVEVLAQQFNQQIAR